MNLITVTHTPIFALSSNHQPKTPPNYLVKCKMPLYIDLQTTP